MSQLGASVVAGKFGTATDLVLQQIKDEIRHKAHLRRQRTTRHENRLPAPVRLHAPFPRPGIDFSSIVDECRHLPRLLRPPSRLFLRWFARLAKRLGSLYGRLIPDMHVSRSELLQTLVLLHRNTQELAHRLTRQEEQLREQAEIIQELRQGIERRQAG